jgi:predicted Rossmann-fold nucleotide-binding protein
MRSGVFEGKPAIAVLGPEAGTDLQVEAARAIARLLTERGYVVVTLGLSEAAEAVLAGALRGGGPALTIVAGPPERPSPKGAQTLEVGSPLQALERALEIADAVVLLEGGLSAMALMMQIWTFGATFDGPYRQVVLMGARWPATVKVLAEAAGLDARTRAMVTFAPDPPQALQALRYYVAPAGS